MSLFGTSWDDPKTAAIMGLAGGLLQGNAGAGLQQGLLGYQRQSQINNQTARQSKYDAREDEEFALKKTEAQRKVDSDKMLRETLKQAAMELQAGTFNPAKYAGVLPAETLKGFVEMPNWGRSEVARTVKGVGPDGREYEYREDKYGQRMGDALPQYRAPLMQDLGGQVAALDPYTLQPKAQFGKSMTPDGRAADARGWASNDLARQRLEFDRSGGGEFGGSQAALVRQFGKPSAGYRWKPDGSEEFIPGGPADQKAQLQKSGEGTVGSVVADLRDKYTVLDKEGGIVSTNNRIGTNIAARLGSTGLGQTLAGAVGTDAQSARDSIAMTRPLLLQAIMKATGMSAKQMDSNAELKLYLATATDPTLGLEANMQALDRIEQLYGGGVVDPPKKPVAPGAMGSGSFGATPTMRWNSQTRKLEPVGGR